MTQIEFRMQFIGFRFEQAIIVLALLLLGLICDIGIIIPLAGLTSDVILLLVGSINYIRLRNQLDMFQPVPSSLKRSKPATSNRIIDRILGLVNRGSFVKSSLMDEIEIHYLHRR